jgi:uncharacterized membrane protein
MILTPEPAQMVRPIFVALRGAVIAMVVILTFCAMAGIDRMQYPRAYASAIGLAFGLHYFGAWWAVSTYRAHRQDIDRNADS